MANCCQTGCAGRTMVNIWWQFGIFMVPPLNHVHLVTHSFGLLWEAPEVPPQRSAQRGPGTGITKPVWETRINHLTLWLLGWLKIYHALRGRSLRGVFSLANNEEVFWHAGALRAEAPKAVPSLELWETGGRVVRSGWSVSNLGLFGFGSVGWNHVPKFPGIVMDNRHAMASQKHGFHGICVRHQRLKVHISTGPDGGRRQQLGYGQVQVQTTS